MDLKELDENVKDFVGKVNTINKLMLSLESIHTQFSEILKDSKTFIEEKKDVTEFGNAVNDKLEKLTTLNQKRNDDSIEKIEKVVSRVESDLGFLQKGINELSKMVVGLHDEIDKSNDKVKDLNNKVSALDQLVNSTHKETLEKIAALHNRVENPPKKGFFGLG
jgi:uncharacterized coiled-coil protein SlyX